LSLSDHVEKVRVAGKRDHLDAREGSQGVLERMASRLGGGSSPMARKFQAGVADTYCQKPWWM